MSRNSFQPQPQPQLPSIVHTSKKGARTMIPDISKGYRSWSSVLELIFRQEGLWGIISGTETRPAKSSYEPYDDKEAALLEGVAKAWDMRNADALLYLYNYSGYLSERVLNERDDQTAHEMWLKLEEWQSDVQVTPSMWMNTNETKAKGLLKEVPRSTASAPAKRPATKAPTPGKKQ